MLELVGIILFAVGILASIALHELGHMLPAKLFGVRVPQYMVGFGPTLWSRKSSETEYGINAIPLGGYVRMVGMFPPRADGSAPSDALGRVGTMIEQARADSLREVAPGEGHRAFYNLSAPRKLTVMLGGPIMNLLIAAALLVVSFTAVGVLTPTTSVGSVVTCLPTKANPSGMSATDGSCDTDGQTPASRAGFQSGDRVVAIAGTSVNTWDSLVAALHGTSGSTVAMTLERAGTTRTVNVKVASIDDGTGARAFVGIVPKLVNSTVPATTAISYLGDMSKSAITGIRQWPVSVAHLARDLFSATPRDPNGPVSVVGAGRISGQIVGAEGASARSRIGGYLDLLASMNLFLFLFNLLPILPLDGGHVAGALFEGVRRTASRLRGRGATGPADTAKLIPVAYAMTLVMIAMSLVVIIADIIKPVSLG